MRNGNFQTDWFRITLKREDKTVVSRLVTKSCGVGGVPNTSDSMLDLLFADCSSSLEIPSDSCRDLQSL